MKKLFSYVIAIILTLSLAFVFVGCDNETEEDENVATGAFKYEIVTEKRDGTTAKTDDDGNEVKDDFGNTVYEQVDYKFYKITGFTVSSDDANKMADGDFSTVEKYRKITIPATYEDLEGATENYPVEEIGMSAFSGNIIFTEVVVGNNIKKIGEGAFAGCTNLKVITLPYLGESADAVNEKRLFGHIFGDAVTSDGNTAVTGKLHQRVDASGTVVSGEEDVSFYVPASLEKVVLNNVTEIGECAFYGMTTLKEVVMPASVASIANHAFSGCTSLLKVEIPDAVKEVGDYAFSGCTSLYAVKFGTASVIESIGDYAFSGCTLLNSSYVSLDVTLTLPATVKTIGKYAYQGCTAIKSVDFSNLANLTVYEKGVFSGCTALAKVNFKSNANLIIKMGAFNGCSSLTKNGLLVDGVKNDTFVSSHAEFEAFDFED